MIDIVNAVLLRQGEVLLAKRSATRNSYPGRWSFPGGHVEAGESLDQALHRELQEEIGIAPMHYRRLAAITDRNAPDTRYHMYAVTAWQGEPTIRDGEHTELAWFTLAVAQAIDGLALEDYRPMFAALMDDRR